MSTRLGAACLAALALFALAAVLPGCGGSGSDDPEFTGTAYPGVDPANTRFVEGPIEGGSAGTLGEAWSVPLTAKGTYGSMSSTPVIAGGVVYTQDLTSNVQAIDLESGDVSWTKKYEVPDQGPNGVVVAEGMVFGATSEKAFGLDQESGEEVWSTKLVRNSGEAIDIAPGYEDGLVYVSTVPTGVGGGSEYPGGGVGTLYALDAKTGKEKWHFDTVPRSLWGDPKTNAGGGLWYPPSFDGKGSMFFGTGNPAPFPGEGKSLWGASRPGPNLYTNSMVKLDAKTGKMDWYFQLTPHDIYDWDFQNPPILVSAGGRDLAIGSGKSGIVVAVDAKTGKPVWKRPVGTHTGHDEDGLFAMRGEYSKLKPGSEIAPGTLGGVIAPMAANATTVFVPVVNHPIVVSKAGEVQEGEQLTGELVAIDIKTGKVKWGNEYPSAAFGAPTAVNDMVFVSTFDGTVHGVDAKTGGEVWQGALPAGSNTGIAVSGDTLVAPAGIPTAEGQEAALVAYRLGGE
ncbi:MAG TPA: PQQ-binding-like beta-propeller repeat protein [Solirubrobacterales bacterium]|nr:PQQ-binding-like beta-propeller repeat protein [Solirubrobacterales bacterium]